MKKLLLLISILTAITIKSVAQTTALQGNVNDQKGNIVPGATIRIKHSDLGTVTDKDGNFKFNVKPGTIQVTVNAIGYVGQEKEVTVNAGTVNNINFTLTNDVNELQSVEITGRKQSSYKNDNSFSATKVEMRVVDIPQSISTVTKELIDDRQAVKLNDIIQNVAGVTQFSNYDDVTMRGFRNEGSEGRLINGLRTINTYGTSPSLVNIEKVEFIKGPASAIFSNTSPGGTINMITKKPLEEEHQSIEFGTGSFNTIRAQADLTGPIDQDKKWLYRLNIGYQNANTYRSNIINNYAVIAPSISFLPQPGTRFNADLVYTNYKTQFDRGITLPNNTNNIFELPVNANIGQPGDFLNQQNLALTLSFSQKITNDLNLNISYLKANADEQRNEHGINSYVTRDSISMSFFDLVSQQTGDNLSAYFSYKANTGNISHSIVGGYDYIASTYIGFDRNAYGAADGVEGFNLVNPSYLKRNINQYTFDPANADRYGDKYITQGIYLQDVVKYKRLQLLLSLRQEFFNYPKSDGTTNSYIPAAISQNKLLPRIGATYKLTDNINTYATYVTGFEPQDGATIGDPRAGGPFKPLTSSLIEAGAKAEFFNKRLFVGTAIYQIIQDNVLVTANDIQNPDLLKQRGQEQSRGIELEAGGKITSDLSVQVSYAYDDAKTTRDAVGDPDNLVGRALENAPKHISGSWIKYTLPDGTFQGLGFGLGHSMVSGHRNTFDTNLQLPGYLVFNSALYYKVQRFKMALNVNNLLDKYYMVGGFGYTRVFPGAPRNFVLNVGYSF